MNGKVQSGGSNGDVRGLGHVGVQTLMAVDGIIGAYPAVLTNPDGSFTLDPPSTTTPGIFYVVTENTKTPMMALIGPELPESIVVNEWTTVAAVYCAAQFLNARNMAILAPSHGARVAAAMSTNIVDLGTGAASQILVNSPNADQTNGLRLMASLANLVAWCVRDPQNLNALYDLTTPPSRHDESHAHGDSTSDSIRAAGERHRHRFGRQHLGRIRPRWLRVRIHIGRNPDRALQPRADRRSLGCDDRRQ